MATGNAEILNELSWIFCNRCLITINLTAQCKDLTFHVTNCGHVFCKECLQSCINPKCYICQAPTPIAVLIGNDLKPEIRLSFQSTSKMMTCLAQSARLHRMQMLINTEGYIKRNAMMDAELKKYEEEYKFMEKAISERNKEMAFMEAEKKKIRQEIEEIERDLEGSQERRLILEAELKRASRYEPSTFGRSSGAGNDTVAFMRNIGSPQNSTASHRDNNSVFNDSGASSNISLSKFPYPSSIASSTAHDRRLTDSGKKSKFELPETIRRTLAKGSKDKIRASSPKFNAPNFFVNTPANAGNRKKNSKSGSMT